jgi:hypothetical protein
MTSDTYHLVEFDRTVEAAAFVAALARVLNSPRGASFVTRPESLEVRSLAARPGGAVGLYLSDAAFEAATAAFDPLPAASTLQRDALPADCVMIIQGRPSAWGIADAERRLSDPAR